MTSQQLDEREIFSIARRLDSPEARAEYVQQVCGDNGRLFDRVSALLRGFEDAGSFLEFPAAGVTATLDLPPIAEGPGTMIGRYKLLQEIGEGGMGVVFMAEQREPIRRKVALKVIKPGMDSRQVIARFEAERQALAIMDHQNIAHVLDAGATESGRPYFVMELVQGIPITAFCDCNKFTTRQRLELFVTVCQAVQHAHHKGIIHRDIKPSNVMVTLLDGVPIPKIIDFGVAKAVNQQLTEKTVFTGYGQMLGTPLYMSPEQAEMSCVDVDTRSDIYSLGVLLYELLTGSTPFESQRLRESNHAEVCRIIREEEPARPSQRISTLHGEALATVTQHRGADLRRLAQLLRGDLDWIVMKALEKDRTRRYESASALAADVQRYLADEPVQARPPTLAHRAAKWTRRHRPLVRSVTAVVAIAAVLGGAVFWSGYRRAVQLERDGGEHLAAATAFLRSANYTAADRELADARGHSEAAGYGAGPLAEEVTVLAAAIAAKTQAMEQFERFQNLRHRVHSEMYAVDRTILDQAQEHCRTALDLFGAFQPVRDVGLPTSQIPENGTGTGHPWPGASPIFQSEPWKSQARFQDLDAERGVTIEEGVVELLFIWARLEIGKSDEKPAAEQVAGHRRAIEALSKIEAFRAPVPAVYLWIADSWEAVGDKKAAAEVRARGDSLQSTTATDYFLLGEHHVQHGRQDQALASYWQALARQPDHFLALLASGVALSELEKNESAEAMLTGAIALNPQTTLGYVKRGTSRLGQGKILLAQADFEQARKLDPELARALARRAATNWRNLEFEKAIADCNEAIRLDPKSGLAFAQRGLSYLNLGDLDMALEDYTEAIRLDPQAAWVYLKRAEIYSVRGQTDKAMADCSEGIRLDPNSGWGYRTRSKLYREKGDLANAVPDIDRAVRLDPKSPGILCERGVLHRACGERDKALADFAEALRLDPRHFWSLAERAALYQEIGDWNRALADHNDVIRLVPKLAGAYSHRAAIHRARGDVEKALADFDQSIRLDPNNVDGYLARAAFYNDRGDLDKALADYTEAIRLDPKKPGSYAERANFHRDRGDFEKALADYSEAIRFAPENGWCYAERGNLYRDRGDFEKALADYTEAIRLDPKKPGSYAERANFHRDRGDFEKALADYGEAIRLAPENGWYYAERANFHRDRGDFDKALADYENSLALLQQQMTESTASPDVSASLNSQYSSYGNVLGDLGRLDDAEKAYRKAIAISERLTKDFPQREYFWYQYVDSYGRLVKLLRSTRRTGEAERLLDGMKAPLTASTYTRRGNLLRELPEFDRARADYDKAIELEPKNAAVWTGRARLYVDQGQWEKAVADFEKALELEPSKADDCYVFALARLRGGQLQGYQKTCAEILQRFAKTQNAVDANWVAWTCALAPDATGDWPTAITLAEKAAKSDPKSASYLNTLGAVLYRAGQFEEAAKKLKEAEALVIAPVGSPKSSPAYTWFFLAMAQQRLRQAEDAKASFDKAVAETDKALREHEQGTADVPWNRRLTLQLLRDEATALLGISGTPPTEKEKTEGNE